MRLTRAAFAAAGAAGVLVACGASGGLERETAVEASPERAVSVASLSSPSLRAPSHVRAPQRITVIASGLDGGRRYRLSIGAPVIRGTQTVCGADLASARTDDSGRARFRGTVPRRLRCLLPDGTPTATVDLAPESRPHLLSVCVPLGAASCDGTYRDVRRPVRITRERRSCGAITFTPQTEDGVFHIRAINVGCTQARRVARASRGPTASCFDGRPCRYVTSGGRWHCRGRLLRRAQSAVRWACLRDGDRKVTFEAGG